MGLKWVGEDPRAQEVGYTEIQHYIIRPIFQIFKKLKMKFFM